MEKTALGTFVAAVVSIIVATIGLFSAIISNRKNARTNIELEKMKAQSSKELEEIRLKSIHEIEKIKNKYLIEMEEFKFNLEERKDVKKSMNENTQRLIKTLDQHIKALQIVRDNLYRYINCLEDSILTSVIKDEIELSSRNYVECYENGFMELKDIEMRAAHSAKNRIINLISVIKKMAPNSIYFNISEADREELKNFRTELGEFQNVLRDKRQSL